MPNPFSPESLTPTWVVATRILKGDAPGHPFHGNQYGPGTIAGDSAKAASLAETAGSQHPYDLAGLSKKSDDHRAAQLEHQVISLRLRTGGYPEVTDPLTRAALIKGHDEAAETHEVASLVSAHGSTPGSPDSAPDVAQIQGDRAAEMSRKLVDAAPAPLTKEEAVAAHDELKFRARAMESDVEKLARAENPSSSRAIALRDVALHLGNAGYHHAHGSYYDDDPYEPWDPKDREPEQAAAEWMKAYEGFDALGMDKEAKICLDSSARAGSLPVIPAEPE